MIQQTRIHIDSGIFNHSLSTPSRLVSTQPQNIVSLFSSIQYKATLYMSVSCKVYISGFPVAP